MSEVKIVECSGPPRACGRQTGEQLREEIRQHLALRPEVAGQAAAAEWEPRKAVYLEVIRRELPRTSQA